MTILFFLRFFGILCRVVSKSIGTEPVIDSVYTRNINDLMEEGPNINLNNEYDTLLQFINFRIPCGCNEDEVKVFEKSINYKIVNSSSYNVIFNTFQL